MLNASLRENPDIRSDEGEVASVKRSRQLQRCILSASAACVALAAWAVPLTRPPASVAHSDPIAVLDAGGVVSRCVIDDFDSRSFGVSRSVIENFTSEPRRPLLLIIR